MKIRINKFAPHSVWMFFILMMTFVRMNVFSQQGHGGQAGSFLRNAVGVRALGLGGAFTAIADDITAAYWNPAGLVNLQSFEVAASYAVLSFDRRHNFAGFCLPGKTMGVLSFAWINMYAGGIIGRNNTGGATGETFSNSENAFVLSYGVPLSSSVAIGASYKYITDNLANFDASGYSVDAGCLLRICPGLRFGLMLRDITSRMEWNTGSGREEKFPLTVSVGTAIQPFRFPAVLGIDYESVQNQDPVWHMGIETALFSGLGFRIGYNNTDFSVGGFIEMPLNDNLVQINYVLTDEPLDAVWVQRFSINVKFRTGSEKLRNRWFKFAGRRGNVNRKLNASTAKVIKIVGKYPLYAIINNGYGDELQEGMTLKIYRLDHDNSQELKFLGTARVVKALEDLSAIKAISVIKDFKFADGDLLIPEY